MCQHLRAPLFTRFGFSTERRYISIFFMRARARNDLEATIVGYRKSDHVKKCAQLYDDEVCRVRSRAR